MNIELSTRGILTAFFRQLGAFTLVFAVILGSGIAYIVTAKSIYRSEASLLVKFGQDAVPDVKLSEKVLQQTSSDERKDFMSSSAKILQSNTLLLQAVSAIGITKIYPDIDVNKTGESAATEMTIKRLREGDLDIEADKSSVISIRVDNQDPTIAAALTQSLIDLFIKTQTDIYDTKQTSFLQQQIEEARLKLDSSRREYSAFKEKVGISSVDDEMTQLLQAKTELATISFQALTETQSVVAELETKEAEMKSTYRPDSPLMERMKKTTGVARQNLKERQNDVRASSGGTGGKGALSSKVAAIDDRIAYLEMQRGQYNELEQQVKMDETNYQYYQQRGEEARVNNLLNQKEITRITVVDSPVVASTPIKPRKSLLLALFILGGLLTASGFAIFRELIDTRFTRPEQITHRLGIPVLATFKKVEKL